MNQISLELSDFDISILNGIRRILFMDIPMLGLTTNIIENNRPEIPNTHGLGQLINPPSGGTRRKYTCIIPGLSGMRNPG